MNFFLKDKYWFIPKNYKIVPEIKLIQVETYEDSEKTMLVLKRNSFIGIFESLEDLNEQMENDNYLNTKSLGFFGKNIKDFGTKIIDSNQNLNKIEFQFTNERYNCKTIFNVSFMLTQKLNEAYKKTKKSFLDFTNGEINIDPNVKLNNEKYLTIDLINWNKDERNLLYINVLNGIYYYYHTHSKRKSFDFGTYNSVIQSIEGKNTIQIYKESIKWFSNEIKQKLKQNNYSFPDIKKSSRNYYNDSIQTFDDTFYNDQLDMDQQSPEFWDNF